MIRTAAAIYLVLVCITAVATHRLKHDPDVCCTIFDFAVCPPYCQEVFPWRADSPASPVRCICTTFGLPKWPLITKDYLGLP